MLDQVDLDPYGSLAALLDSMVRCVADGGTLMCSAIDMIVLAGWNANGTMLREGFSSASELPKEKDNL
jgi:tRNA G26 N,N-dimethylase Trm1